MILRIGEGESELGADTLDGLDQNISTQGNRHVFAHGEAKADTFFVHFTVRFDLCEGREKAGQLLRGHTNTWIFNDHLDHFGFLFDRRFDADETLLGVLNGIWEQVDNDLFDSVRISINLFFENRTFLHR